MTRTQFALIRGMVLAVGLVSCSWGGEQSNPEDFLGWWYMGTMTGQDTNLNILPNGKLAIQCGGCFKQDPWIYSSWRRHEDKIIITRNINTKKETFVLDLSRMSKGEPPPEFSLQEGDIVFVPRKKTKKNIFRQLSDAMMDFLPILNSIILLDNL